jgi:hypothetical protein
MAGAALVQSVWTTTAAATQKLLRRPSVYPPALGAGLTDDNCFACISLLTGNKISDRPTNMDVRIVLSKFAFARLHFAQ